MRATLESACEVPYCDTSSNNATDAEEIAYGATVLERTVHPFLCVGRARGLNWDKVYYVFNTLLEVSLLNLIRTR
jgi:hypothetical protein